MINFKNSSRFFMVLAFASTLFCTPAHAQTRHASEIARLAQAHSAGEVVIGRGDAVSLMAQSYSRANDMPFDAALKGLIAANPAAFEDAQHNLIVGAKFVLPTKEDILKGVLPVVDAAAPAPVAVLAPAAAPLPAVVETKAADPVVVPAQIQTKSTTSTIWLWLLLAVLVSMILVRLFKWQPIQVADDIERHENGAPKVVLATPVQAPVIHTLVEPIDEDDLPELDELDDDDAPLNTPILDARFSQALAGLSADSLDLTRLDNPAPPVVESIASTPPELPNQNVANQFFNYNFKTPMQQWRELNVVKQAETTIHAKVEAMKVVQVAPEILEIETAAAPELNMDMPKFLNAFSHNLPEPTFTSVDYEDLLDKARLQAWLNIHTPEQILLFAQDAYDARYGDVAQLMLNDVLLRGNAEQVGAVLNLRYLWSYPAGVY